MIAVFRLVYLAMRHTKLALLPLLFPLGLAACSEGSDLPVGPEPTGPDVPAPRDLEPVPGGGTSGEDLDGVLTVFVLSPSGLPVADAPVLAGGLMGKTDAAGRVDLHGDGLTGALDVHVFAPDHAYHSTMGLRASALTVALAPAVPSGEDVELGVAEIAGAVEGWHLLPAPSAGLARVITVEAFAGGALGRLEQHRRPGSATIDDPDGMPANIALDGAPPYATWRDFTLRAQARARGLVAYGATFDPNRNPALVRTHIGLVTGLELADGEVRDGVELRLSHPLDQQLRVEGPVTELERRVATFALDLGEQGIVPLEAGPLNARNQRGAKAPSLVDGLAEARYLATLHLSSIESLGGQPVRESLGALRGVATELDFRGLLPAPGAPALAGRTLAAPAPDDAELGRVRITDGTGRLRWEIWRLDPGAPADSLPLPPEGFEDGLPEGLVHLESSAFDLGVETPAELDLRALEPRAEAHHRARVER